MIMKWTAPPILWFVSPILGLASIFVSVLFADQSLLTMASYRATLPSVYFIAVTLAAAALADAFEYAAHNERAMLQHKIYLLAAGGLLFTIVFLFANVVLFIYAIKAYAEPTTPIRVLDVFPAFMSVIFATIIGFGFKAAAESVK